jgi:hypothetical protein
VYIPGSKLDAQVMVWKACLQKWLTEHHWFDEDRRHGIGPNTLVLFVCANMGVYLVTLIQKFRKSLLASVAQKKRVSHPAVITLATTAAIKACANTISPL